MPEQDHRPFVLHHDFDEAVQFLFGGDTQLPGPKDPVLACADCNHLTHSAELLNGHTQRRHGRPPTREERTPTTVDHSGHICEYNA